MRCGIGVKVCTYLRKHFGHIFLQISLKKPTSYLVEAGF